MARYAMVRTATGKVENVIEWDGNATKWAPPSGCTMVVTATGNIGDTWDGTSFTPPPPPGPDPLAADLQRLFDYMPASGTPLSAAVTTYIGDTTKPSELRATMAALRSLVRVVRGLS